MSKRLRLFLLVPTLLLVFFLLFHFYVHFDWLVLWLQLKSIRATNIAIAVALIYLSVLLRALRWSTLVKPLRRAAPGSLVGPQFIGFACVALIGSLGDLTRPYLLARRLNLPLSSQLATYTIERIFDIASIALVVSISLLLSPVSISVTHRAAFRHLGIVGSVAAISVLLAIIVLKFHGERVITTAQTLTGRIAPSLAPAVGARLRSFRDGLTTISSIADLAAILAVSLLIWGLVALAYLQVAHAFVQVPQLAFISFASTMILLAASVGGSLVQLPIVGWFTQIAATAATIHTLLGIPIEAATACGTLILAVTFVSLIPAGIIFLQLESVSVRTILQANDLEPQSTAADIF